MAIADVAKVIGWSASYLSEIETGRKNPPRSGDINELARILGAEEQAEELQRLAEAARATVVLPINAGTDPEVAEVMIRLGKAFHEGRIDASVARRIGRVLSTNTAVA